MKKIFFVIIAAAFIFFSCQDPHLPVPNVPKNELHSGADRNVPFNLSATHGEKQRISLSWNPVSNAALYYIYSADSPLSTFTLCGETSSTSFTFKVSPGSTIYYRVSSCSYDGTESDQSNYVIGTSLAQPLISDITDISEESSSVTWYMNNVSKSTCTCPSRVIEEGQDPVVICTCQNKYYNDLIYVVYCFNGDTEFAQILLKASEISENRVVFTGLYANTIYMYQVEAYLRTDQSASEKSEKMDAATARRFRPGAPEHLTATSGASANKIALTFVLPDKVDLALGENKFDPKPLYFTISKRIYSESHSNAYQLVCSYFGEDSKGGQSFEYIPGAYVTWEDNIQDNQRGVTYEYLVQSYVDNTTRIISSDTSRASAIGWALSRGTVSYGKTVYVPNVEGKLYIEAKLPVIFNFDTKGVTYDFTVVAYVKPIDDILLVEKPYEFDPDADFVIRRGNLSYEDAKNYILEMDLTQKSCEQSPGRGIYSVEIEVNLPGQDLITTFKAIGSVEISEDTSPIVVENFSVQDGYTNKFVLSWDNHENRRYTIEESVNGTNWTSTGIVVNPNPVDNEKVTENYKHEITGQASGITRYFRIRPASSVGDGKFKDGQPVYAPEAQTLGVPELSLVKGLSYSVINPEWTEAQKADTYRIKYRYTEDGANAAYKIAGLVTTEDIFIDASGKFSYSFKPEGYNDVSKAGKEIQIKVDALNRGLQSAVGGGEISTTSVEENVKTKLVGTALLNTSVTKATSSQDISVSWDGVTGAGGYYVFRRQFNLTNAAEEGSEAIVYYVPATSASSASSINITGKNLITDHTNSRADTTTVKVSASFANSRYTLRDMFLSDNEYSSLAYANHTQAYRNQQNDIVQGLTYRYFVVPVIVRDNNVPDPLNAIEFTYIRNGSNKNTSISSFKIRENNADIQYTGAAAIEKDGFTIGFGQNVTASKGTYSTEKDSYGNNVSSGIRITWEMPSRLKEVSGFTPRYTLYGRVAGTGTWTPLLADVTTTTFSYKPPNTGRDRGRGIAYEYAVSISNAGANPSSPHQSIRFIAECAKQLDDRGRQKMLGFMLDMIEVEGVSRNELRDSANNFAEEVKWFSGGVYNPYNSDNVIWGIDGYDLFVMNRNINANWHRIADVTSFPNQLNQNVRVSNVKGANTLQDDLLKVIRDYKHFFKVRSYVKTEDGEKVYCPDPVWTYQYRWGSNSAAHIIASDLMQNDFVKWGARQITANEFIRIGTLYMARGLAKINGTAWNTGYWQKSASASTGIGGSGNLTAESNFGVTEWEFVFNEYKEDMMARCGTWMTFITINGKTRARTGATNQYPQRYREWNANTPEWLDIRGPWDTPNLYTGKIRVGTGTDNAATNLHWGSGRISIQYPSGTATQNISWRGEDSPLPFSGRGDNRHDTDAWK